MGAVQTNILGVLLGADAVSTENFLIRSARASSLSQHSVGGPAEAPEQAPHGNTAPHTGRRMRETANTNATRIGVEAGGGLDGASGFDQRAATAPITMVGDESRSLTELRPSRVVRMTV